MANDEHLSALNTTKFFQPMVPDDYIPRPRLNALLNKIPLRPLTLIAAPAGYGKSTAASAWLRDCPCHRVWLSLDEADNDVASFLIYLLAAIQRAIPAFGLESRNILEAGRILNVRAYVNAIFSELDALNEHVVIVIDDCTAIHNDEVLDVIREFMRHPHPFLHLVLLSRHDISLPLNDWRARNRLIDIRSADLRFNPQETAQFLQRASEEALDDDLIAALHQETEGWIAGLRLATISLAHGQEFEEQTHSLNTHNRYIVEYLAEQVIAGLPADWRSFLIQTSILERMSGPLCEVVVDNGNAPINGQAILLNLHRENLFMIPLDSEMRWFRYHHLFGEFLMTQLIRQYSPEAIAELHRRAGRWFGRAGFIDEALRHLITAGDYAEAADLVAKHRHDLMNSELWQRLQIWLRLFPQEVIDTSPDLLMIKVWYAHAVKFDLEEIQNLTERVAVLLPQLDLDPNQAAHLAAENDIFRGIPHYYRLNPRKCWEYCRNGLDNLPQSYYATRSLGWTFSIGSAQQLGDMPEMYNLIRQARSEDLATPDHPRVRNAASEGFTYWMTGDLAGVEKIGQLILANSVAGREYNTRGWGHYFLASAHYHWNDIDVAAFHAQKTFDGRFVNNAVANAYAGYILALVHQAAGRTEEARNMLTQIIEYATEARSPSLLVLAEAFQAEIDLRQDRLLAAARWAERVLPLVQFAAMPLFFSPLLTIPKALLAANDPAYTPILREYLLKLRNHVETIHNTRFLIETQALEAWFHDTQGDSKTARMMLERSLSLAEPGGFIRLYVDLGPPMKQLLNRHRSSGPLTAYISRLLAAFPAGKVMDNQGLVEPLTERELEVLTLLARRYSNKEIAAELFIAPVTVKRHTINIYQKLLVQSRRDAVQVAQQMGIIE